MLVSLIYLLIYLAVIAIVIGVAAWAIKMLFPQAPSIIINGLYVIGVLIALLIVLQFVGGMGGIPGPVGRLR